MAVIFFITAHPAKPKKSHATGLANFPPSSSRKKRPAPPKRTRAVTTRAPAGPRKLTGGGKPPGLGWKPGRALATSAAAERVIELADGVLQTGPTYFERDRKQAIAVPWEAPSSWNAAERAPVSQPSIEANGEDGPDEPPMPTPSWRRPASDQPRAPYTPPASPRGPL